MCKKISITLVVFENRVETNANMKINFHVWTFTEQVHKQRKKASSDFSLSWQKKYQVSILPISETVFFWNISFDVFTSDLAPWSLVSDEPFLVTKSSTFEGSKKALLFCHNGIFRVYHIFNGTCPQEAKKEKKMRRQLIVAFEKQTLKWQRKEDKIICGKANSYFRRLSGPFRKNEEISKVVYFFSFGLKLKMKLVETVSVSIGVKFRQTSYGSKTN